ncbi:MAG: decaprenyl-phosphate phosphoribosyltransferase [Ignavibacteria bacterium]|nr:decaprenyl-phosphate phosphoribosyltransferase [Ignavibacteria bacterium]
MKIRSIVRLIRVPQWIKNCFVLVPLIFSQHVFEMGYTRSALLAVLSFCFISSAVYVLNDIVDRDSDKMHPVKKNRPLASGALQLGDGVFVLVLLIAAAAGIAAFMPVRFMVAMGIFFLLNVFYSFYAKHVVLLDIFCIAGGFMLRVFAGAFAIGVLTSSWLILTTMFISLFLGVMKRRSELVLLGEGHKSSRKVLEKYTVAFTDQMANVTAAAVIICYALYTTAQRTIEIFHTDRLVYTTPFVVFGIFRYMYLVYKYDQGENTTEIMMHDFPMIATVLLYLVSVLVILYNIVQI